MKRFKHLLPAAFLILAVGSVWAANEDNRPIGADQVRSILKQVDSNFIIRFSTTIPANTNVKIFPDQWATYNSTFTNLGWTSGVTYSTTPNQNNGGRLYMYFQAIEPATAGDAGQKLHWSFNTSVSTNTDPYITLGQSWPPVTFPFVYQSTVTVFSTATFKIGGFVVTEKSRRGP